MKSYLTIYRAFSFINDEYPYVTFNEVLIGIALMQPSIPHGGKFAELRSVSLYLYILIEQRLFMSAVSWCCTRSHHWVYQILNIHYLYKFASDVDAFSTTTVRKIVIIWDWMISSEFNFQIFHDYNIRPKYGGYRYICRLNTILYII